MYDDRPTCPECGDPLSLTMEKDEKTSEFIIDLWCEGAGEDQFHISINTGLIDSDLDFLDVGEKRVAELTLVNREKDPDPG